MKRLTQQQKQRIKELKGLKNYKEIAKEIGVSSPSVVSYHIKEDNRQRAIAHSKEYFKNLPRFKKKKVYKNRADTIIRFVKNKYKTDEEFRKERIEYQRDYYKRKKKEKKWNKQKKLKKDI